MDKRALDDGTVLVCFQLPEAVAATTVSVVGDFNGWAPQTHPLARVDGGFRTEIALPAGDRWRFRYLLDGERWENDWAADDYVSNGLGADDSVVDLTAPDGLRLAAPPADGADTDTDADRAEPAPARGPGRLRRWWRRVTRRQEPAAS